MIGLGAHGSSTAYHLARAGARVLGLERSGRAHPLGSSGGLTRVIRLAYFEHPDYVPLLRRAWDMWRDLEKEAGETLLLPTGGLYVGPPESDIVKGSIRSAVEHALPHEVLDAAEIRARYPAFRLDPGWVGLYERQAGVLLAERCIEANLRLAEQNGADLRYEEPVLRWRPEAGGLRVDTRSNAYVADRLVITAGAWISELVPEIGRYLWVERVPLLWFEPREPDLFAAERFPVYLVETKAEGQFYGFPFFEGQGLKVARHHSGERAAPDRLDRSLRERDEARIRSFLRSHLPSADGLLRSGLVCMYTNSPDGHFIIDRSCDSELAWYASACSGHGFKFASVIGRLLTELVTTGRSSLSLALFSGERFAERVS